MSGLDFVSTYNVADRAGADEPLVETFRPVMHLERLRKHPTMRDFLRGGGELFLATEHRDVETIAMLYDAGHRHFAEKFVLQTSARFGPNLPTWCDLQLSCYGQLQTNKVRKAMQLFRTIESIGSERLAQCVRQQMDALGDRVTVDQMFIQVNQGREPQKNGVWPEHAQRLIDHCIDLAIPIAGLMTIPPRGRDPEPYFRSLRSLADANRLHHCQMGMTDDWQQAVNCGATRIRIGRGIFGPKADGNGIVEG